ncbi:MAG: hypothetical protein ACOX6Q_01230 [Candidatus Dojkabacteria bacterium]|jgi:predicted PurR-regulated permease PerM
METVPPIFWMIIVSILTIMLCVVLYYLAMLLKESRDTVSKTEPIIKDLQTSITSITETLNEINTLIIKPVRGIGAAISVVNGIITGIKKDTTEKE